MHITNLLLLFALIIVIIYLNSNWKLLSSYRYESNDKHGKLLDSPSSQLLFNRASYNTSIHSCPLFRSIERVFEPRIAQTRSQVSQLEESWNGTRFDLGQDSVRAASLGRWGRSRPLLVCFLFLPDAIPRPIKPRTGKENKLRNGILGNWYGIPINNSPYLSLNDVQLNAI